MYHVLNYKGGLKMSSQEEDAPNPSLIFQQYRPAEALPPLVSFNKEKLFESITPDPSNPRGHRESRTSDSHLTNRYAGRMILPALIEQHEIRSL